MSANTVKPVFSVSGTATGGRGGHSETADGVLKVDLSMPEKGSVPAKAGTVTPEHLFATGYAACFGGAVEFVAKQHKKDASKAKTTCTVAFGPREGGGFGINVTMKVEDKGIATAELRKLVEEAHEKICPYSHATRGNVDLKLEVAGA